MIITLELSKQEYLRCDVCNLLFDFGDMVYLEINDRNKVIKTRCDNCYKEWLKP